MATDQKVTDLANKPTPAGADLFMIVDVTDQTMAASGTNKNATVDQVAGAVKTSLQLGTAAFAALSLAGSPTVPALAGTITPGHLATFADPAGTLQDGGPIPTGNNPGPQPANTFWAGPASGASANPTWRLIQAADVPPIPESGVINLVADLNTLSNGVNASLAKAANLADLTSPLAARNNLGLVASATIDTTNAANISTGTLPAGRLPALTGDVTTTAGSAATTLAPTPVTPGNYQNANISVDQKGRITLAASGTVVTPGGSLGQYQYNGPTGFAGAPTSYIVANQSTSGVTQVLASNLQINQSGAAGYYGYVWNITENTIGTGARYHSMWQLGGTPVFSLDRYGRGITGLNGQPTLTLGNGAGASTGGTGSVTGNDTAGIISITTGTAPAASVIVFNLNYGHAYDTTPRSVTLTPGNAAAAVISVQAQVWVDTASMTAALFSVRVGSTPLAANVTYIWHYHING